jgi:predicted dehydrogenase
MARPETSRLIRLGIVGSHYGCTVLLPAFRAAGGFDVTALAGADATRTAQRAHANGIPRVSPGWPDLVDDAGIDAVAIAVPPHLQPEIATRALERGKAVFAEKPLAADLAGAQMVARQAASRPLLMIDFEFPELPAWRHAKDLLDAGAIGTLRHVNVTWMLETYATRMRLKNWKTNGAEGGGVIGNLVSHCFHYLEWFAGPLAALSARMSGLPGEAEPSESTAAISGAFASGASLSLAMSAAAYLGSGHRIEFYGEDGTLALANPTSDYMRGFEVWHAKRPADALTRVDVPRDATDDPAADARIAPVRRLAARFREAIETGAKPVPGLHEALRVQLLIDAARCSNAADGREQPIAAMEAAA